VASEVKSGRILFVEDEDAISEPFSHALKRAGFEPVVARTAAQALDLAERLEPDLVLLDLRLPDGDGWDVCRQLRRSSDVPIVMLTARGTETDRIIGLELGADDYVVKPYDTGELLARIHAVSRRTVPEDTAAEGDSALRLGPVQIELPTRRVTVDGTVVQLTRKEFDLLALLAQRPGVVFRREQIISEVWRTSWEGTGRTLEVHVASLRAKLRMPALIETVRGVGYRLVAPAA
jgi:DNA-binding response OmpR family regulator